MRPATFWKRARFALCGSDGARWQPAEGETAQNGPAIHGDRTLIVPLLQLDETGSTLVVGRPLYVVNCHLSAGQESRRRLRQVHEALEAIRKARAKLGASGPGDAVVMCGDFNSQGQTAVRQLLCSGEVLQAFRESGDPTEVKQGEIEVTSKPKRQAIGRFEDVAEAACADALAGPTPTLIAPALQDKMQDDAGAPTSALLDALGESFGNLSKDGKLLTAEETERWLILINKQLGRGSEFRAAAAARQARGGAEELLRDEFIALYVEELRQRKFWGVEHDLRVMRGAGLGQPGSAPFTARFDYVYACTSGTLRLHGWRPPLGGELMDALLGGRAQLPNEWYPSDHLPVAVAFEWHQEGQ